MVFDSKQEVLYFVQTGNNAICAATDVNKTDFGKSIKLNKEKAKCFFQSFITDLLVYDLGAHLNFYAYNK